VEFGVEAKSKVEDYFMWINFGIQCFFKFTYKIWSNFEMIQILKCTPNSNFKMEAKFENVP